MKVFMVIASLVVVASAEPPSSYGAPSRYQAPAPSHYQPQQQQQYGPPANQGYNQAAPVVGIAPSGGYDSGYGVPSYTPQVFKHVYIHAAPDEPEDRQVRTIRVPGGGDKHVNIIFVKAPTHSYSQQTEVILPEQAQQKTVVYVLVKKPENYNNVKVTGPAPHRPHKPEVFFIRYKDAVGNTGYGPPSASPVVSQQPSYGVPSSPPASAYGAPAQGYNN